jgi:hypothetical protein
MQWKGFVFFFKSPKQKNPNWANSNSLHIAYLCKWVGKNGPQRQTLIRKTLIVQTLIGKTLIVYLQMPLVVRKCAGKDRLQRQTLTGEP